MRLLKHEMEEENRKTGIDVIGDVPWGTHFCQFYETKEDLVDVLVPYFKAGLENNEFCMWVTSEPLSEEEAEKAMRKAVPNFDGYLKRGQIEIVPHTEWYLKDGVFNLRRVLNAWIDKLDQALAKGYDGLRVTGNTAWLEKNGWRSFVDYEEEVNDVIGEYRMMAICTYSLDRCGASEVIDVVRNHQFSLIRRRGEWELIESSGLKWTKEALRESEEKYRNLFENARDAIMTLDLQGNITFVNRVVEEYGFKKDEIVGKNMAEFVPEKYLPRLIKEFAKVVRGNPAEGEIEIITPKGKIISEYRSSPIRRGNKVIGSQTILRDITERKKAEKALRESEEKFRNIFESASDCMAYLDMSGIILDCNRKAVKVFGESKKELLGKPFTKVGVVSPRDIPTLMSSFAKVLTSKQPTLNLHIKNKKGQEIPLECSGSLMKTNGKLTVLVIARDVTERKRAEEALRKSEEKYRSFVELAPDGIVTLDLEGVITSCNTVATRLTGYSKDEIVGKHFSELGFLRAEDIPKYLKLLSSAERGKVPKSLEVNCIRKDGTPYSSEVRFGLLREGDKTVGFQVIGRDITERKKAEEALRASEGKLNAMLQSISDRMSMMDKDLNILWANETAKKIFGDDIIGKKCYEVYHRRKKPCEPYPCLTLKAFQDGKVHGHDTQVIDKDGKIICFHCTANVALRDKEGKPTAVIEISRDTTEQKKTEEALRESEEKYRELINGMNDTAWVIDFDGKFIDVNDAAVEVLGYSKEELLSMGPPDIDTTLTVGEIRNLIKQMSTDEIQVFETTHTTKDGKTIPVEISSSLVTYQGKHAILSIARDITERKLAEEELVRLSSAVKVSTDSIVISDLDGKIIDVNEATLKMYGTDDKGDLIGKNSFDLIVPEERERALAGMEDVLEKGYLKNREYYIIIKNGGRIPVEMGAAIMKDADGKPIGFVGISRDITERKQMEEKLRQYSENLEELVHKRTEELIESEKRYSVLVEEASDGVVIIQDGKFVFANKKAVEIVGYSRDELIELPFEKLLDEKYLQLATEGYMRVMRGGKIVPATAEVELIAKTGERVPVEGGAKLINYQGHPANLVIVRDIRERKRMEEQRLKLEKLATIGELATMVGHDLRNPLQAIENATYYLKNELPRLPIPQKTIEMLQIISNSVNYADKIVRDLHDFSATKKPILQKININTIVKKTLSQVKTPENVELITELGHLPKIKADKDMIKRVLLNLAINGIQAMEKGGTLKVSTKKTKEFVKISFKDTGAGISKQNIKKIFTPFFTTKAQGMGMGLAICKKLVESHGGSIEVESKEGKGSTFTVKLSIH